MCRYSDGHTAVPRGGFALRPYNNTVLRKTRQTLTPDVKTSGTSEDKPTKGAGRGCMAPTMDVTTDRNGYDSLG